MSTTNSLAHIDPWLACWPGIHLNLVGKPLIGLNARRVLPGNPCYRKDRNHIPIALCADRRKEEVLAFIKGRYWLDPFSGTRSSIIFFILVLAAMSRPYCPGLAWVMMRLMLGLCFIHRFY
jgi:hypothetical protein